jgi:hypothetical protein
VVLIMPQLEFVTKSTRDADFVAATTERLLNLYPEPLPEGSPARFQIKSVLGMQGFTQLAGAFVRAFAQVAASDLSERLFGLSSGRLVEIAQDGSLTDRGAIPDDPISSISGNNGDVTIVGGGRYFVWDGATLTEPTAGAFSDIGSVTFLGGYTILTELGGRQFLWSALADAGTLPGLNFATAEARDDAIIQAQAINGNLWIFKSSSIEIWAATGQANENAFSQIPGTTIDTGLRSFGLVTNIPNGAFFVGNDGKAYLAAGAQISPASNPAVETAIQQGEPTDCFYYEDEGHSLCVIRFDDRPAWVLDLATNMWHERASMTGPWTATGSARAWGFWAVAGIGGDVSRLARTNADNTLPLIRRATSRTLYIEGERFRVMMAEFLGRMGRSSLGRPASVVMRVSRDGGLTWGNERTASMGAPGQYDQRVVYRNLGIARRLTVELTISDPADLTLLSSANVVVA